MDRTHDEGAEAVSKVRLLFGALAAFGAVALVIAAAAFAWGNPKLSLKCDEGTGEAVLTYENPTFSGDVDLRLWQNGTPVADKRVNGHTGELRYKMTPGDFTIDARATNHVSPSEIVETSEPMHCGKVTPPPAPPAPQAPPAVAPPVVVTPPATSITPVLVRLPPPARAVHRGRARCVSMPQHLGIRARERTRVSVHVRGNDEAVVRLVGPGVHLRKSTHNGVAVFRVRAKRSGRLVVQSSACFGARVVHVGTPRQTTSDTPPESTG
jgi:hypothetical protein